MLKLGQVVMTKGVDEFVKEQGDHCTSDLMFLIGRHSSGDWGDIPEEDIEVNKEALEHGERIMSSYELCGEKIWIITEWDRSVTTVLFPSEY